MEKLIKFCVERSLLVNLVSVAILVAGAFSAFMLQKDMFPNVDFGVVIVSASYPGSSSEDVEKLVTIPLERAIKGTEGLKELNAISAEGRSILYGTLEADADTQLVLDDIKNAIDTVSDLPDEVEKPTVTNIKNTRRSIIKVAVTGGEVWDRRRVAKSLQNSIEDIQDIALVDLSGDREKIIKVAVDLEKLNSYDLTMSEVAGAIKSRNINLSAGNIKLGAEDIMVRTISEFVDAKDVEEVIIRSNSMGFKVRVSDVAIVEEQLKESSVLERASGKPAVILNIRKKESADNIRSTKKVKRVIEEFFKEERYSDFSYTLMDDLSFYVKRRLGVLTKNGMQGIFLVFLCLMLFLNFRTSLVTSLGAPLAFLVSFSAMDMVGMNINLISMFGLILVLGMLVDDSIIVAEQFYQYIEAGMKPKEAAIKAAVQTQKPVLATVLTTIAAFGALLFMGGIMGKFLWPVPAVVIICLLASWFECFFILPSHLAEFVKVKKVKKNKKRWYEPLSKSYSMSLNFALKFPKSVVSFFLIMFVGSLLLAKQMKFELFPGDDVRIVFMHLKGPVGTPLRVTDEAMKSAEKIILKNVTKDEFEGLRSQVGLLRGDHGNRSGTHYGTFSIYLTSPDMRNRGTDEIVADLISKTKGVLEGFEVLTKKAQGGPPKGKPVDIQLRGEDLNLMKSVARTIEEKLSSVEGVVSTEVDYEEGKKQIVYSINESEALRLGLTARKVALELRMAFSEDEVTQIRESDEDIDIVVQVNDQAKSSLESLDQIYVLNNQGRRIKLSKVATASEKPGAFVIRRFNRKRTISITAELNKSITTPVGAAKTMKPYVTNLLLQYPKLNFEFGGENKDTQESMMRLSRAAIIALFIIFTILVAMFTSLIQPLIIMSAIPLGLIGVVITFFVMGKAISFMALLGVIGLVGVVVNDSIVLVNFINIKMAELDNVKEAIRQAAKSRFRPVILTTFTTVAGLLPIAHSPGGDPFLKPMALSFAYGLIFSTALTLIFVPCLCYIYFDLLRKYKNYKSNRDSSRGEREIIPPSDTFSQPS
ncbi:MAG: efflux RND transporter permease subunit [Bacteriovoracaceae bacterium]|jgi:multidrug efflux pump subunit AcrB|nr:efflux RND transporter permease subunit [Bacteriovoracaceae bacterium]